VPSIGLVETSNRYQCLKASGNSQFGDSYSHRRVTRKAAPFRAYFYSHFSFGKSVEMLRSFHFVASAIFVRSLFSTAL